MEKDVKGLTFIGKDGWGAAAMSSLTKPFVFWSLKLRETMRWERRRCGSGGHHIIQVRLYIGGVGMSQILFGIIFLFILRA